MSEKHVNDALQFNTDAKICAEFVLRGIGNSNVGQHLQAIKASKRIIKVLSYE